MCPLAGENWDSQFSARTYRERDPEDARTLRPALPPTRLHPPSDFEMATERREANKRIEAAQREKARIEREAAQLASQDLARRREIEARRQAFLLECELEQDLKDRIGL